SPRTMANLVSRPETRAAMSMRMLSASPWTSSGSGRARYQIASPTMTAAISQKMIARGLTLEPPRTAAAGSAAAFWVGGAPAGEASVIVSALDPVASREVLAGHFAEGPQRVQLVAVHLAAQIG